MKQIISYLFVILLLSTALNAGDAPLGLESFRQRSMGGASIAVSHDDSALYKNPAGLYLAKFKLKFPRVGFHINNDISGDLDRLMDLKDEKGKKSKQLEILRDLVPKTIGLRYSVLPALSWTWQGIGVGVMAEGILKGTLHNKVNPQLRIEGQSDIVPAVGIAQSFNVFGPTMLGVSAKYINRSVIYDKKTGNHYWQSGSSKLIELINTDNDNDDDLPNTYTIDGVGFDLGLLRKIDSNLLGKGHWGIAVRNLGASLSGSKEVVEIVNNVTTNQTVDASQDIPLEAGIGIGLETGLLSKIPAIGWMIGDVNVAADYYFVSDHSEFLRNLKMGVEKKLLWDALKLRGGLNAGYIVGGVGLDVNLWKVPLLHISYSYYVEEFGESLGDNSQEFQSIEVGVLF